MLGTSSDSRSTTLSVARPSNATTANSYMSPCSPLAVFSHYWDCGPRPKVTRVQDFVTMRRVVLAMAVAALVAVAGAAPAHAGKTNLTPVQDRYEPGDIATFVP